MNRMLPFVVVCGLLVTAADVQAEIVEVLGRVGTGTSFEWQDTGIDVVAGQTLEMTATGLIQYAADGRSTDPNGYGGGKVGDGYGGPLDTTIFGSLVGKIEDTLLSAGTSPYVADPGPGFVGTNYSQVIANTGRLYLGYNDGGTTDNAGSFTVEVNAVPEPSSVVLLGIGLCGVGLARWRSRRRR